jgi:osmotically-inducible protein OsmY
MGTVDSRDAKWLTEDLVNSVTGVREVNNRLRVAR